MGPLVLGASDIHERDIAIALVVPRRPPLRSIEFATVFGLGLVCLSLSLVY